MPEEEDIERLRARIAELERQAEASRARGLQLKVSEKGGVSVYGLGRFPVTLYQEQWVKLLDSAAEIRQFIEQNKSHLKVRGA